MLLPGQESQSYPQARPSKPAKAYSRAAKKASRLAAGSPCRRTNPDQWLMDSSERPRVAGPSRIMTMPTIIDTPMKAATPGTP